MQIQKKTILVKLAVCLLATGLMLSITGCGGGKTSISPKTTAAATTAAEETSTFNDYATLFGVIIDLDTTGKNMTVLNIGNRETASFTYTGGTMVRNKYGDSIAMSQIEEGEIINLTYKKTDSTITEVDISADAWEVSHVTAFTMDRTNKTLQIGSYLYKYESSIVITSDGELVEPVEISDQDELIVKGYGTTVYSIDITKGHGYVSLLNEEYFVGGILTIGKTAKQITDNMLVVVPEGDYTLEVTKGNTRGRKSITVEKNKELSVDVKDFVAEARQMGTIVFKVQPPTAVITIDGKESTTAEASVLEYGTYNLKVEAEGYAPFSEKYTVDSSYQEKNIVLEALEEETAGEGESSSGETGSTSETEITESQLVTLPTSLATTTASETASTTLPGESVQATASGAPASIPSGDVSGFKIHITEPSDTEVYFDGDFLGTTPVSLTKVSGEHTIILRKDGYETKTYTVNISSDQIDSYYSFPALAKN